MIIFILRLVAGLSLLAISASPPQDFPRETCGDWRDHSEVIFIKISGVERGLERPGQRCEREEERSLTETITASLAGHSPPTHNPQPILSIRLGDLETITTSNQGNQAGIILLPSPSVKSFREVRQKFGSQKVFGCEYIFSNCLDIYQQYKGWSPQ